MIKNIPTKTLLIISLVISGVNLVPMPIIFLLTNRGRSEMIIGTIVMAVTLIPNAILTIPVIVCLVKGIKRGEFSVFSTTLGYLLILYSSVIMVVSMSIIALLLCLVVCYILYRRLPR